MIPDNIQANIMKYLNNGVSGSSQEQKPVVSSTEYNFNIINPARTNAYFTEDNKYIVIGTSYRNPEHGNATEWGFTIYGIEDAIKYNKFHEFYKIPNYDNKSVAFMVGSLNRDEEGRFYAIVNYGTTSSNTPYLVIFNDFLTDGIIQINKAYNLSNITFKKANNQTGHIGDLYSTYVMKLSGKAEYIFYSYLPTDKYFYFIKLKIDYNNVISTTSYKFSIVEPETDFYLQINDFSVNTTSENTYAMISYNSNYEIIEGSIKQKDYNIGIVNLPDESEELIEVTIKRLYNNSSFIRYTGLYSSYLNNGLYMRHIISKYENNIVTLKYILVRADGTTQIIDFPTTFNITNFNNINLSITDTFIILGLYGDTNIKRIYKLSSNTITFIDDLEVGFGTAENYILKQYNLYYVFTLILRPMVFIVKDVPTYGRFKLLKQKFLNSKLFRTFKFKRNK